VPGQLTLSLSKGVKVYTSVTWLVLAALSVTCWLFLSRDALDASRYYVHAVGRRVERRAYSDQYSK
jgi:hypothetical protein